MLAFKIKIIIIKIRNCVDITHDLSINRFISSSRLNVLLRLHLSPINLVIYKESMILNLGACFALICFQRLSEPNIATEHCPWQDSSYTRDSFIPVLSY